MDHFVKGILVETGKTDKKRMAGILAGYGKAFQLSEGSKTEGGEGKNDGA